MLSYTILFLLSIWTTKIQGLSFRYDYAYSELAEGWLKFHKVPATWNDAKIRCHAEGAVLASPETLRRQQAILQHMSKEPIEAIFTGMHASYSDREFTSIEGVPLSKLPISWSPGKPKGITQCCLAMLTKNNGTITDVPCNDTLPYVCFRKWTQLKITECGTHDTEYKLDVRTESCYKFHRRGLAWDKAFMACAAEGAHLVVINSDTEAEVLVEILLKYKDTRIFSRRPTDTHVGIRDLRDGGSWMTIHGETLQQAGFDKWSEDQPNNYSYDSPDGEACGVLYRTGLLNDIWCGLALPFVCEKKPDSLADYVLDTRLQTNSL